MKTVFGFATLVAVGFLPVMMSNGSPPQAIATHVTGCFVLFILWVAFELADAPPRG